MKLRYLLPLLVVVLGVLPAIGFGQVAPLPSTCGSNTLAQYELYDTEGEPSGCSLGGSSLLDFQDFSFSLGSEGSISASQIEVTPDPIGLGGGFIFCATPGTACVFGGPNTDLEPFSGGYTGLDFNIGYDWSFPSDPYVASADIGGDPPTGNVVITETFCGDPYAVPGAIAINACTNGPYPTGQTFVAGFPSESNSYDFPVTPPAAFDGIIGLNFDIAACSTLGALSATNNVVASLVPEPFTVLLSLGGLTLIGALRRRHNVG